MRNGKFSEVPGHTLLLANYTKGFYRAVGWIPTTLPLTPAVAVYKLDELYTMDRNEIDKTMDNITNNKWDNKRTRRKKKTKQAPSHVTKTSQKRIHM